MKAIPLIFGKPGEGYIQVEPDRATHLRIKLPGPTGELVLPVQIKGRREGTGNWTWNGDTNKPTLKPSVKTEAGHYAQNFNPEKDSCWCKYNEAHPDETPHFHCFICHTHINDGRVNFLMDSTHDLKGQTLDLLDL